MASLYDSIFSVCLGLTITLGSETATRHGIKSLMGEGLSAPSTGNL